MSLSVSPDLSVAVGLITRFMQNPHESHWKAAKIILVMFEVQFSLGFIIVQKHLLYWLVSLIPIGLVTLMIRSLLQVMCSLLVQDLLHGLARNKVPLQQSWSQLANTVPLATVRGLHCEIKSIKIKTFSKNSRFFSFSHFKGVDTL